ncbi:uncharacterized protein EURHEDRAFT_81404 [Aspergillus ruber CBS 135680]|uniref:Uncharacterized protein n=1 Tax=Aspergillus ruber (strain CBS 135680) TaxID=1388766 RepID=A0A017SDE8_ASPRC|nr:uncharacterized protein EURHEDRAFT_81404 [Aspergillus ruber CBS 135680]EYE94644.1 hypothetical protein EURHEDRAFT_81404 [Aspergillus ruber CBS 135680]
MNVHLLARSRSLANTSRTTNFKWYGYRKLNNYMSGDMIGSSQAVLSFPTNPDAISFTGVLLADLGQDDAVIPGNFATDRAMTATGCFKREIAIGIVLQSLQVTCMEPVSVSAAIVHDHHEMVERVWLSVWLDLNAASQLDDQPRHPHINN